MPEMSAASRSASLAMTSVAEVNQIFPFATTGDDQSLPRIRVFQAMFVDSSQRSGKLVDAEHTAGKAGGRFLSLGTCPRPV